MLPVQPVLFAIISIGIIIGVAFGSYFYLQRLAEQNVQQMLLEQQKQRQQDNTEALASHIGSNLHSITLLLKLLATNPPLQNGDLSGEQTNRLLREALLEIEVTKVETLFLIDSDNVAVNVANEEYVPYVGLDLSDREYVKEVMSGLRPYISDSFTGAAGTQTFVIAVPIINSATGEYVGNVLKIKMLTVC